MAKDLRFGFVLKLFSAILSVVSLESCTERAESSVSVVWSAESVCGADSLPRSYRQRFVVKGDLGDIQRLAFNQFARKMELQNPADTLIEIVPGYYAVGSPRFSEYASKGLDSICFEIITRGRLSNICYSPDGVHIVREDGTTAAVDFLREDILKDTALWGAAEPEEALRADSIYALNQRISVDSVNACDMYNIIPSFKSVRYTGGTSKVKPSQIRYIPLEKGVGNGNPEYFRVTVDNNQITIESASRYWKAVSQRLIHIWGDENELELANVVIEDYPDYEYRGLMIDVARNFIAPQEMHRVIDLMSRYGLNKLHFHFTDDEAWRLEIKDLPELVKVGSRRGYTLNEKEHLAQIFAGDGNPEAETGTANGYYTRQDFIEMLRYADSLAIDVIPEIESPGHARAAIKAMEYHCAVMNHDMCHLIEDGDTSKYTSAQAFHDNIMNPALPGPYDLMRRVATDLKNMYAEAGVKLQAIHIGGDEVPRGAWDGSAAVKRLKADRNLKTQREVQAYFAERVRGIFWRLGIKMSGWQDIAIGHDVFYNKRIMPSVYSINSWTHSSGSTARKALEAGYPVVLSNVDYFYLDMAYSSHPYERGLMWGGTVDEFRALHGYRSTLCPEDIVAPGRVIGVQGQVFGETLRSADDLETMLLPKMLGLAERAWNSTPTYTDAEFHKIIVEHEIPYWQSADYAYHLRQPGIMLDNENKIVMNSAYPDAVIRYTVDGTAVTATSEQYSEAIDRSALGEDVRQIRARAWLNNYSSVETVLTLKP